jgi:hypothetical protein
VPFADWSLKRRRRERPARDVVFFIPAASSDVLVVDMNFRQNLPLRD